MSESLVRDTPLPEARSAAILGVVPDGRSIVEAFFRRARVDRKKWTRLARESGVSRSTIARWEEGVSPEVGNFVAVVESAGYTLALLEHDARQFGLASRGIPGLAVDGRKADQEPEEEEPEDESDRVTDEMVEKFWKELSPRLRRALRSEILRERSDRDQRNK